MRRGEVIPGTDDRWLRLTAPEDVRCERRGEAPEEPTGAESYRPDGAESERGEVNVNVRKADCERKENVKTRERARDYAGGYVEACETPRRADCSGYR